LSGEPAHNVLRKPAVRKVSDGRTRALESSRAIVAEILLQEIRELKR
jgi:hypothetical protein